MVESTGLENRRTLIAYLGFKSLSLRHFSKRATKTLVALFVSAASKLVISPFAKQIHTPFLTQISKGIYSVQS